jgi:C4-dicarboxylate transporter, DcuC family
MLWAALLVVAGAVFFLARRAEPRLVLLAAGLALCALAGKPLLLADAFARGMVAAMVAPICAAMGFAAVLRATGCDRDLVGLLVGPLRRARLLALPGGICAAYAVNLAVPSQAGTAATLGPVLVPLLLASGHSPTVAGAALILGASFGGDLLSPGAQDVQAIAGATGISASAISARVVPASLAGVVVAAVAFTVHQGRGRREDTADTPEAAPGEATAGDGGERPNPLRALIPVVPVVLLLLAYGGVPWLRWLVEIPDGSEWKPLAGALPVVRALLIGSVLAALTRWRDFPALTRSLFDGMGAAYGSIISLTITAQCFGAGVAAVGLGPALLALAARAGALPLLSAAFPWTLAVLSGSGSGPILAYAQTFLVGTAGMDNAPTLAALACLGGAFGRTMSPVAAVVVYAAGLVGVAPLALVRALLPALLAGAVVALVVAGR